MELRGLAQVKPVWTFAGHAANMDDTRIVKEARLNHLCLLEPGTRLSLVGDFGGGRHPSRHRGPGARTCVSRAKFRNRQATCGRVSATGALRALDGASLDRDEGRHSVRLHIWVA